MNKNIEIINSHLWAVKFSWLPWITDIKLEANPGYPLEKELARTTKEGIIILNADFHDFGKAKIGFLRMQKITLIGCTFTGGYSEQGGGAIYNNATCSIDSSMTRTSGKIQKLSGRV
jgi:hypothetical protein